MRSILVVDDQAGVRAFFRSVLEDAGYEVSEATNGKEAMEQIRRTAFDLAIMDIIMPEQDGIETIRTLKTEQPGLKVIVISGAFSGSDLAIYLRTGELLGATASLQKPVSAPAVIETVRRVLGVQ